MSRWRAKALELFPEKRGALLVAPDYKAVWKDLHQEFRASLASGGDEFAKLFFRYACWVLGPSARTRSMDEMSQAAAEVFYEFADDLHRWIDRDDFIGAQIVLRHCLGDVRYGEFEHRFLERTPGYVKRAQSDK